jgi:hypothetical protein
MDMYIYIHILFVPARSKAHPEGKPNLKAKDNAILALHNLVTLNTFEILKSCAAVGIPHSLEQPFQSTMFHTQAYLGWEMWGTMSINVDYCGYGMEYRKRTKLVSWQEEDCNLLRLLEKKCTKKHTHIVLSGWKHGDMQNQPTNEGSCAYPVALCKKWAEVIDAKISLASTS